MLIEFGKEGYSGAALVARNGEIILRICYGLADRGRKIPNTPETLFNVASVGKTFTTAAVLKLEMQGKLKTTDPISKHLGEFPGEKNSATIHHLLTHTSGLIPEGFALKYDSREAFVESVRNAPLESKPGEKYRYSNSGYTLLAAIVEKISGVPFEVYLQKNIFDPAALTSTCYPWDARFASAPVAVGYACDKLKNLKPVARATDVWGNRGSGNLITTVGDLYKWTQSLRNDKVLSKAAKKKMFTALCQQGRSLRLARFENGAKHDACEARRRATGF